MRISRHSIQQVGSDLRARSFSMRISGRIARRADSIFPAFVAVLTLAVGLLLVGCRPSAQAADKPEEDRVVSLIMSDIGFNSEVIHVIKDEVAKRGFTVKWVVVNDIIQPNKMVDAHEADAVSCLNHDELRFTLEDLVVVGE